MVHFLIKLIKHPTILVDGETNIICNQSTHSFEYNSHSGWLQKTHTNKFYIKIIKNNQIMANS